MDDDIEDGMRQPGAETILRATSKHDTFSLTNERPLGPPPWRIGDRVGPFVIEKILGSGVTSTVFRVRDVATNKSRALKVMRVRNEACLAASRLGYRRVMPLVHPSLVRIHAMHTLDGMIAFSMDEVDGTPMSQIIGSIASDRELVFRHAKRLAKDVGGALRVLHAAGFVHRDVKPDNLLVQPDGRIRLIDYGLVGCFDPESDPDARRSYLAGTFWYMAPESIYSQIYPPACDVYALGCVLLELIGLPSRLPEPQAGKSLVETIGEVDRVIPDDTPEDLRDLLREMLDPKSENRPLASQVSRYGRSRSAFADESQLPFRPVDLIGREAEMAIAEDWFRAVARSQRGWLHISGDSGTGKSWFAEELRRRLSSNAWFQVFRSSCLKRDDVSLQVFDEIADAIARRYTRDDRSPLWLSAVSASMLRQSFPALRPVIRSESEAETPSLDADPRPDDRSASDSDSDFGSDSKRRGSLRSDAMRAGVEIIDRLCEYGPVLLIIDDLQWADPDSVHLLDQFLDDVTGPFGLITISRGTRPQLRHVPDRELTFELLDDYQSVRLLMNLLGPDRRGLDTAGLDELATLGGGNTFRLAQLAMNFSDEDSGIRSQDHLGDEISSETLWQAKFSTLTKSAWLALRYLTIAGGPVNMQLLCQVAGVTSDPEQVAWELIRHHLARESLLNAADVVVAHHRIEEQVLRTLEPTERAEIHHCWADHLIAALEVPNESTTSLAARIAWHLQHAGREVEVAPYALQAAGDAISRFAYFDAGKWLTRVADLTDGPEAEELLHQALDHFETAGHADEAAATCRRLLAIEHPTTDPARTLDLHQRLCENLVLSGKLRDANAATLQFARCLGITPIGRGWPAWLTPAILHRSGQPDDRHVHACLGLAWILASHDPDQAARLAAAASRRLARSADPVLRLVARVTDPLMTAGNPGPSRAKAEQTLLAITDEADSLDSPTAVSTSRAALASFHALEGRWATAAEHGGRALQAYSQDNAAPRFEAGLIRSAMLWTLFTLGRFREFDHLGEWVGRQADQDRDVALRQLVNGGLAAARWLYSDQTEPLRERLLEPMWGGQDSVAPATRLLGGFGPVLFWLYLDRPRYAYRWIDRLTQGDFAPTLEKSQILRILCYQYQALAAIRNARTQTDRDPKRTLGWLNRAMAMAGKLRHEATDYAELQATLIDAQVAELTNDRDASRSAYRRTVALATDQQIEPARLVAVDRLADAPIAGSKLRGYLRDQGIRNPDRFERLIIATEPGDATSHR